jgi:glycosyltransferase involved in cell wall biosynthesis
MHSGDSLSLNVLLGLALAPRGPSYTMVRVLQGMVGDDISATVFAPVDTWRTTGLPIVTGGVSGQLVDPRVQYRLCGDVLTRRAERRLLDRIGNEEQPSLVYTWGEASFDFSRRLHERGTPVVREKYNCAKQVAKDILDRAYNRFGIAQTWAINQAMVEKENAELALADAVFCPSPMVAQSLVRIGVPEHKLLHSSYGWEPERLRGADKALEPADVPTLLFVGFICVRKGAHLLLEAWQRAKIKGRLVLVGDMEPLIAERYGDVLARDDVVHMPFASNVGAIYRSADWFIFPTLEEGSPLVTYEAAACGVPVLVSPMGAGAFVRDGIEGVVTDSDEAGPWAELIATVPDRMAQRQELAEAARARAYHFTYDQVGARRREQLLGRFAPRAEQPPVTAAI